MPLLKGNIYFRPIEDEISKWEYFVDAQDKDGDLISDVFELQVIFKVMDAGIRITE